MSETNELNIPLHPKQREALKLLSNPSIRVLGYGGARGGGKSHLSRAYLVLRALKYPGTTHLLLRRSYPELVSTHIVRFIRDYSVALHHVERFHRFDLDNGSYIDYRYVENEKDLARLQGSEYATIVIDEAQYVPWDCIVWLRSILRTTDSNIIPRQLYTFNPGGVSHNELKKRFIQGLFPENENKDEYHFLKSLVYDNPSLDKAYIHELESLPEPLRSAYLNGDFDALLGSFFLIDPDVLEDPFDIEDSQLSSLYLSLDHGIQHHTSAGCHYMSPDGTIHRLWSYLANGYTAEHHAREILDRCKNFPGTKGWLPKVIVYDSSMAAETKAAEGLVWSPLRDYQRVWAGTRSIWEPATRERIWSSQLFASMLCRDKDGKLPRYRVWRDYCPEFDSALATLERDKARVETWIKVPTPADDLADEARYMAAYLHGQHATSKQASLLKAAARQIRERQPQDWYAL